MSTTTPIQLIVGLGNPGDEYTATRHNAGVWFVENIAHHFNTSFSSESKFHGFCAKIRVNKQDCRLLIPTTFMNNSGTAVQAMAKYYDIPPAAILIAHDELDLACGTVRLKYDGGHGGHNGLRDIIEKLKVRSFCRLRIGIDRPRHQNKVIDYVLHKPGKQELNLIQDSIDEARSILPYFVEGQIEKAMQILHTTKAN